LFFSSLRRSSAQRDALKAAADVVLDDQSNEVFAATLNVIKSVETQRNDLAHGLWAVCNELPDAMLWIEQKHAASWLAPLMARLPKSPKQHFKRLEPHLFVYTKDDLLKIDQEIESLGPTHSHLSTYLTILFRKKNPEGLVEVAYRQLCSLHHIQRELDRMRQGQKNTP
jgi:hypothetical protein